MERVDLHKIDKYVFLVWFSPQCEIEVSFVNSCWYDISACLYSMTFSCRRSNVVCQVWDPGCKEKLVIIVIVKVTVVSSLLMSYEVSHSNVVKFTKIK